MSKRKPMDKAQARERRNQLLESAAAAELSLTEGVREMRAIAGMTQEEFAKHRGVSARVIKAIELGQGNPTVATLNRIGDFFGLEVAFVPKKRAAMRAEAGPDASHAPDVTGAKTIPASALAMLRKAILAQERSAALMQTIIDSSVFDAVLGKMDADNATQDSSLDDAAATEKARGTAKRP